MNLVNDTLHYLTNSITVEQLRELHADTLEEGLKEVTQPKNPKSNILAGKNSAVKIEQLKNDLARSRETLIQSQNEHFKALIDSFVTKKNALDFRKIEVVHPRISTSPKHDESEARLSSTKMNKFDWQGNNVVLDDIDEFVRNSNALKVRVANLGKQFDQIGIIGGSKNQRIIEQSKLLQLQARALRAQLVSFKKNANKHLQERVQYVTIQLDRVIDEVTQIVEESQRHRKLVDGLGVTTKPSHRKPLLPTEEKEVIDARETGAPSSDVLIKAKENQSWLPKSLPHEVDHVNKDGSDAGTDVESASTEFATLRDDEQSSPGSTTSLSSINLSTSLESERF